MTVPSRRRSISKFKVFSEGLKLRKAITELISRRFGYKPYPNPEGKNKEIERRNAFNEMFIDESAKYLLKLLRSINSNIHSANSIFPTNMTELEERRLLQDKAIADCNNIAQELQYVMETIEVDLNKIFVYSELILNEIELIKSWRKSDNRFKQKILSGEVP